MHDAYLGCARPVVNVKTTTSGKPEKMPKAKKPKLELPLCWCGRPSVTAGFGGGFCAACLVGEKELARQTDNSL